MYIVTTQQMQAAEKAADAADLSYDQMMEHAGHAVAEAIAAQFEVAGVRVLVLVGPGNNGGDGLVVARYLSQMGATVTVYVWKRNLEGDHNWDLLDATGVECVLSDDEDSQTRLSVLLAESAIIVDALLGTGVSRPIKGTLAELLDQTKAVVAERRTPTAGLLVEPALPAFETEFGPAVVAVDVPSGLNSDTGAVDPHTLKADLTVTLAAVKYGHLLAPGLDSVGQLVVGDIGITPDYYPDEVTVEMATAPKVVAMLPERPASGHKGTFGTALIVAGSLNYTGAARLSGQAATRSGAGLVTLAPPRTIYPILAAGLIEATYLPLPDEEGNLVGAAAETLRAGLGRAGALLIGPGLGQSEGTDAFLSSLLAAKADLPPLVLDADALNTLAKQAEWWQRLPPDSILTPHPGEMARLMDSSIDEVQANRLDVARDMAARWSQIVLLKGAYTIIAAPDGRVMVMPFANPALAKAGSGDVLAGTIVSLRAQGVAPFEAAIAGAYLHGVAGEIARESLGAATVVAGDLVNFLPTVFWEVAQK